MDFKNFCFKYNLGTVLKTTELTGGLLHKNYKVETTSNIYAIKVLNPEIMKRKTALTNFLNSELIANLAAENTIPAATALKINNNIITKYQDNFYMVFPFYKGKTLTDAKITPKHCQIIGNLLSEIHNLNYQSLSLEIPKHSIPFSPVDWNQYVLDSNFSNMSYQELYLNNYKKYPSLINRCITRFPDSSNLAVCHNDMDPKNILWDNLTPTIIDWESASISNPYLELIEDALYWSGFLSHNFSETKFLSFFKSYFKTSIPDDVDWYNILCGNLLNHFSWLDYNLKRSLSKNTPSSEGQLAQEEVTKTINEINYYLELIGPIYQIIMSLIPPKTNYDNIIKSIIKKNSILPKNYHLLLTGFTNTIIEFDSYIVRICTDLSNEEKFKKEISIYQKFSSNSYLPKMYKFDTSKKIIPYYYEIIEKVPGKTLYELWYQLSVSQKENIIKKVVTALKSFHIPATPSFDFKERIKNDLKIYLSNSSIAKYLPKLLAKCDLYFLENEYTYIHGDLHFDNIIYNQGNIKIIDFEYTTIAPLDYDLIIFNHYSKTPWLWASYKTDMLTTEIDYEDFLEMFINNYEELKNIKYLKERLSIYYIIENLKRYKDVKDSSLITETISIIENLNL